MSDIYRIVVTFVLATLLASCGAQGTTFSPTATIVSPTAYPIASTIPEPMPPVSIARFPKAAVFRGFNSFTQPPVYDPKSSAGWQVDLRSADLTELDLSKSTSDLLFADFDSKTQWPSSKKMPADFDRQKIMEIGKDPGLGMRALHDQGITGNGVGIAIIDQTLLVDHIEYKDRIRVYEEAEDITGDWLVSRMHGAAVASIAVGKTTGVAPKADLYFIATAMCSEGTYETNDFACLAKSIRRIIEINKSLPTERKIRVLSISVGWGPESQGYEEVMAAVNEAKAAKIFVLNTSLSHTSGLNFHGLGRAPLADPNDFWSYKPGLWWQDYFYKEGFSSAALLVPMDSRTTASPTGAEDYVFYRQGGWSWAIPYLAGMYALTVQVKPEITPEQFWKTALNTGRTIQIGYNGKDYEFGVILDPQALIEAVRIK